MANDMSGTDDPGEGLNLAIAWEKGYKASVQYQLDCLRSGDSDVVAEPSNPYQAARR